MKYIALKHPGGADQLCVEDGPLPNLKDGEVLIRVHAAGVNRPDILQREGRYPPPSDTSPVLGLEVAGEIVACGAHAERWQLGQAVCALVNGGGYAEFAVAPAAQCLPLPNGFSFIEAAALPETCFTVWHNVFQRAQLKRGETLLVHGGGSGIGICAIQLATAFGAQVFATAGSDEKCRVIESLGATGINYRTRDFVADVKAATGGKGAAVILDMVGGPYVQRNLSVAAKDARIVNIAFLQGSNLSVDLMPVMLKRLTLTGSTMRGLPADIKANIARDLEEQVWPLLNAGKIKPMIDSTFFLSQVAGAHTRMESNQHIGKIVLDVKSSSN